MNIFVRATKTVAEIERRCRERLPADGAANASFALALLYCSMLSAWMGGAFLTVVFPPFVAALYLRRRRLRCAHPEMTFGRNLHGDEINARGARSEWLCPDCGKLERRPDLYEIPTSLALASVFAEIEELALEAVARERDLLAARLRGLVAFLKQRGVVVEWKGETAAGSWEAVAGGEMREAIEESRRQWRQLYEQTKREKEAAIARFNDEARSCRRLSEELNGARKLYAATRANLAEECGHCLMGIQIDGSLVFHCTGRGRVCSSPLLSHFQLATDRPPDDDDCPDITNPGLY